MLLDEQGGGEAFNQLQLRTSPPRAFTTSRTYDRSSGSSRRPSPAHPGPIALISSKGVSSSKITTASTQAQRGEQFGAAVLIVERSVGHPCPSGEHLHREFSPITRRSPSAAASCKILHMTTVQDVEHNRW
jgi:hypothetical protein